MTQQEYFAELERVFECIQSEKLDFAEKKLQELYEYKPVRLKWFVYKAELLIKQKRFREANELLRGKFYSQYNYAGIEDVYRYYERRGKEANNQDEYNRSRYYIESLKQAFGEMYDTSFVEGCDVTFGNALKKCLDNNENEIEDAIRNSYVTYNLVFYMIASECYRQDTGKNVVKEQWVKNINNMGYLLERLEKGQSDTFLLIESTDNETLQLQILKKILERRGKKVIYCVTREGLDEKFQRKILNLSLKNEYGKLLTVIATGTVLNELSMCSLLDKNFSKFDMGIPDFFDCNLSVAWLGDYCAYIEKIYDCNVTELINKKPKCQYSIVIPARNSTATLEATIKTCLEIPYEDYEIVISDNSTNGNVGVYELCQKINSPKIKYYRTPRNLRLTKSFEYAILQSEGEFIVPIGSDDGVLPWIFETLDNIRKEYPQEMIIQWERGFYAWRGFNGAQQNEFVIPDKYIKDNYGIFYKERSKYLAAVLTNPEEMYLLPMLYINSGFKREYLNILLQKTGRLWDGICQDIYMGIINVSINQKILNIQYPLTIAGMSSGSEGAKANEGLKNLEASNRFNDEVRKNENVGGFSLSNIERLLPELRTDRSSLYSSCLRAVDRGALSREYLNQVFDWKMMFLQCLLGVDVCDVEFDRKIHYARYVASWHGEDFLKWFDEVLYDIMIVPQNHSKETQGVKGYVVGKKDDGESVLDASEYEVDNIYDAVKLFQKMCDF